MRVLIVGATGLLGSEVVRLLSPEHQVIGASRNGPDLSVDLTDKASIVSMYRRGCRDLRRRCREIRTA